MFSISFEQFRHLPDLPINYISVCFPSAHVGASGKMDDVSQSPFFLRS